VRTYTHAHTHSRFKHASSHGHNCEPSPPGKKCTHACFAHARAPPLPLPPRPLLRLSWAIAAATGATTAQCTTHNPNAPRRQPPSHPCSSCLGRRLLIASPPPHTFARACPCARVRTRKRKRTRTRTCTCTCTLTHTRTHTHTATPPSPTVPRERAHTHAHARARHHTHPVSEDQGRVICMNCGYLAQDGQCQEGVRVRVHAHFP
jgi:hypothetical protein